MTTPPLANAGAVRGGGLAAVSGNAALAGYEAASPAIRIDPVSAPSDPEPRAFARSAYTAADFRKELARSRRARRRRIAFAVIVAAVVVATAVSWLMGFAVRQVAGASMEPALSEGQVVLTAPASSFTTGAVVAFEADGEAPILRYGRVVAMPGEWVNISGDGTVAVSSSRLAREAALSVFGSSTGITARQVPEGCYYVLGDADEAAASALLADEGFVEGSRIVGSVALSIWPVGAVS